MIARQPSYHRQESATKSSLNPSELSGGSVVNIVRRPKRHRDIIINLRRAGDFCLERGEDALRLG